VCRWYRGYISIIEGVVSPRQGELERVKRREKQERRVRRERRDRRYIQERIEG